MDEQGDWFTNAYRALTQPTKFQMTDRWSKEAAARDAFEARLSEEVAAGAGGPLTAIMMISPASITKIAVRFPGILSMSSTDLAERLVALKVLLPGCDVALMVERVPAPYLSRPRAEVEATVATAVEALRDGMKGADIERMLEADPGLLFVDVVRGVRELRELWDVEAVDEQALANSSPTMLALAVRTLSDAGPPSAL